MRSFHAKGAAYAAFPLVAAGIGALCHNAKWHGDAELHTLLEAVSVTLALVAGAIALKGHYTSRTSNYLLLGSGLAGAGLLGLYHAVTTSSFVAGRMPGDTGGITAWSEWAPPVFLALFLGFAPAEGQEEKRATRPIEDGRWYTTIAGSILAVCLALTWAPLPFAFHPQGAIHRPAELVPAVLFACAGVVRIRKGTWKTSGLEHWLILSLIAAASGHLFFQAFSGQPYDALFFLFHLSRILSSTLILAGLFSSVSAVYRGEARAVVELRGVNQALAEQIRQRERAEEELRRSRDELDTRVRERTADLQEQTEQLESARAETELLLSSIPSVLIGLDSRGRITRWNPAACETFGISAADTLGGTLDNCGIHWLTEDIHAEMTRWLLSGTLRRCDELTFERNREKRSLGLSVRPIPGSQKEAVRFLITGADITERRKAEAALDHLAAIVESCDVAIISVELTGVILSWNAAAERMYGYSWAEVKGRPVSIFWPPERLQELAGILETLAAGQRIQHAETLRVRKDGGTFPVLTTYSPIRDRTGRVVAACSLSVDITERKLLERQLAQAQKLESIGQLASGIAHEINTPIQYVGDNIRFLKDSFARLEPLFDGYERLLASVRAAWPDGPFVEELETLAKASRADYLRTEIPRSLEDSLEGTGRVAEIVRAMKEFSHPGAVEKVPLDINRAIESTVLVSRNEWKYVADLHTELEADLPPVVCVPGEFNQVVLNLIVNAAHSVADVVRDKGQKGSIVVSTHHDGGWAEVRVKDSGTGIPEEIQANIFNPFFTTKGVGKGTGQGLAIAYGVIVRKHGGTISFDTAMGAGSTFKIRLPIDGTAEANPNGYAEPAGVALRRPCGGLPPRSTQ